MNASVVSMVNRAETRRFKLLTVDELVRKTPPRWLVQDALPEGISVLVGAPNAGKTFLALDLALCVGSGLPWHARATQAGTVVYVAGEGASGLGKRVQAWRSRYVASLPEVRVIEEPVFLDDEGEFDQFLREIRDLRPTLVVIDPFAECFQGDENLKKDVAVATTNLKRLRRVLGVSVLLLHHSGWGDGDNKRPLRERGSNQLRAMADWTLAVAAKDDKVTLSCLKARDFENPGVLATFRRAVVKLDNDASSCVLVPYGGGVEAGAYSDPVPRRRPPVDRRKGRQNVQILKERYPGSDSSLVNTADWRSAAGVPPRSFYDAANVLVEEGWVDRISQGVYRRRTQATGA